MKVTLTACSVDISSNKYVDSLMMPLSYVLPQNNLLDCPHQCRDVAHDLALTSGLIWELFSSTPLQDVYAM